MAQPTLEEVFRRGFLAMASDIWTSLVVQVDAWYPETVTVDVTPVTRFPIANEAGEILYEGLPQIPNVPVKFPVSGNDGLVFPIAVGSHGLLTCTMLSFAQWRTTGSLGDAGDTQLHSLGNVVFTPGVHSDLNSASVAALAAIGKTVLDGQDEVLIGKNAEHFLPEGDKLEKELNKIGIAITALGGSYSYVVGSGLALCTKAKGE